MKYEQYKIFCHYILLHILKHSAYLADEDVELFLVVLEGDVVHALQVLHDGDVVGFYYILTNTTSEYYQEFSQCFSIRRQKKEPVYYIPIIYIYLLYIC